MSTDPKPILRVGKIKASGRSTFSSVQGHINRTSPTPNASPARSKLNQVIYGDPSRSLEDLAVSAYAKYGIERSKLRKDATLANDIIMSCSPSFFRPDDPDAAGTWDENRLAAFKSEALAYLRKGFGERLLRADLHLDEATPHIHAVVVPILPSSDKSRFRLSGKDMFNPKTLSAMQAGWERAMSRHGVGARLIKSKAKHVKLRDYYSAIAADETWKNIQKISVSEPPERGYFTSKEQHKEDVRQWRDEQNKKLRDELRPLNNMAAKARLYDVERLTAQAARADATASRHEVYRIAEDLAKIDGQLELAKDEINALRNVPIRDVSQLLEYDGPIDPKENAIDFVKRVGELDFKRSVAWLHSKFGHRTAAAALSEYISKTEVITPITKAERTKQRLVEKQLKAMDAEGYRITIFRDGTGWNFGVQDKSIGKDILSPAEVIKAVPKLQELNHAGCNIFVTPIDSAYHHILVDDLNNVTVTEMVDRGYKPCVTMETSRNNFQAVLRVPRAFDGTIAPEAAWEAANAFFKDLNRARGDEKIVGLERPMRLAGFKNRKDKHKRADGSFPFVRLVEAVRVTCHNSVEMIRMYARAKLANYADKPKGPKR